MFKKLILLFALSTASLVLADPKANISLIKAIRENNIQKVQKALNQGADVNAKAPNGNTALIIVIKNGSKELIELLLSRQNLNINAQGENGNTALTIAVLQRKPQIVNTLLSMPNIEINIKNAYGKSALMIACRLGCPAIAKSILNKSDVNVNLTDNSGKTAISLARENRHDHLVNLLLNRSEIDLSTIINNQDDQGHTILMQAIRSNDLNLLNKLLNVEGININLKNNAGETALTISQMKRESIFFSLLSQQSNVNFEDININNQDSSGDTILIKAVRDRDLNLVQRLLSFPGINLNLQNNEGEFALLASARHQEIYDLLIAQPGIDVNLQVGTGFTLLMMIAFELNDERFQEYKNLVEAFLKISSVNLNIRNHRGETALSIADTAGNSEVFNLLLQQPNIDLAGVNINARNHQGETILIRAIRNANVSLVTRLLSLPNMDLDIQNNQEQSALTIARNLGNQVIINLLQNHRYTCLICDERKSSTEMVRLSCGHIAGCVTCINEQIRLSAQEKNPRVQHTDSNGQQCNARINLDEIKHLVTNRTVLDQIAEYEAELNRLGRKLCPNPECNGVFFNENNRRKQHTCDKCNQTYCAKCLSNHKPKQRCVINNTKPCPNCRVMLSRTDGCNHMTCHCGYQFCWICTLRWNPRACNCPQHGQPGNDFNARPANW